MVDLFNNNSNDYINPDLSPCAGSSDQYTFEFLPNQQVGIVSGDSIISAIPLGDIFEPVIGWVQQTKILQPGEITFIPGMTKGISNRLQYFPFIGLVRYNGELDKYYMSLDISINYYKNFKYYEDSIFVKSDHINGITIENALNIKLNERKINIEPVYDPSGLTFRGTQPGYTFNITSLDVSLFLPLEPQRFESLVEDVSSALPAFKYPNGAMLGYVLKVIYPPASNIEDSDKYIKINHVPNFLEYFVENRFIPGQYERFYDEVDVGLSGTSHTPNILSAADYLHKVETNNMWENVGIIRIWLSSNDFPNTIKQNLIKGFYIFNPQSFPVKINYITIL